MIYLRIVKFALCAMLRTPYGRTRTTRHNNYGYIAKVIQWDISFWNLCNFITRVRALEDDNDDDDDDDDGDNEDRKRVSLKRD